MHINASKWDKENEHKFSAYVVKDDILIPKNRPCDWCGERVKIGYIHPDCEEKETRWFLDTIY